MPRKTVADLAGRAKSTPAWIAVGVDTSMSSIALAAIGYDATLKRMVGPTHYTQRWPSDYDYFLRLKEAALAPDLIQIVNHNLGFYVEGVDDIFIAVEEPWPLGMAKRAQSGWIKQQAQIQGAFLGGLARYGYPNIFEINWQTWLNVIRQETGMTIPSNKEAKWKVKEWAIEAFGVEDLPDLINSRHGKIRRPENSRAKAVQPEDVYDALGIMAWCRNLVETHLVP